MHIRIYRHIFRFFLFVHLKIIKISISIEKYKIWFFLLPTNLAMNIKDRNFALSEVIYRVKFATDKKK